MSESRLPGLENEVKANYLPLTDKEYGDIERELDAFDVNLEKDSDLSDEETQDLESQINSQISELSVEEISSIEQPDILPTKSHAYTFFRELTDDTPFKNYIKFLEKQKEMDPREEIKHFSPSQPATPPEDVSVKKKKKSRLAQIKSKTQAQRKLYFKTIIEDELGIQGWDESWSEEDVIKIIERRHKYLQEHKQETKAAQRLETIMPQLKTSIEIENMKMSGDDDDNDPLALLKKYETLLIAGLRVPFYVHKLLPAHKKNDTNLAAYMATTSTFILPLFEILSGLWSFRKIYRLLDKEEVPQFKTKLLFHVLKLCRLALGVVVIFGHLPLNSLLWMGLASSLYNLFKTSYILYNTHKNINKTQTQIDTLTATMTTCDDKDKPQLEAQIKFHRTQLLKLKTQEYFQTRAVCRSILLVVAAGLSLGSIFIPVLGIAAFGITLIVTIQAREDLKEKRKLFHSEINEPEPTLCETVCTSLKETAQSVSHGAKNAKASICGFFKHPPKKEASQVLNRFTRLAPKIL